MQFALTRNRTFAALDAQQYLVRTTIACIAICNIYIDICIQISHKKSAYMLYGAGTRTYGLLSIAMAAPPAARAGTATNNGLCHNLIRARKAMTILRLMGAGSSPTRQLSNNLVRCAGFSRRS